MKILKIILAVFLVLIIGGNFIFYFLVYKDVVTSFFMKKDLRGEIVYGLGGHTIKVIELPSQRDITVYSKNAGDNFGLMDPYFSPDGSMVVFSRDESSANRLFIMDSNGANVKLFLDLGEETNVVCPSWSPDGKKIAFIMQNTNKEGLYVIDRHTRAITRVSSMRPEQDQPSWSPDSKKIAFTYENKVSRYLSNGLREERNMSGVCVVDIATGNIENYIDLAMQPAWSPDGAKLAFEGIGGYHIMDVFDKTRQTVQLIIPVKKALIGIGGSFPVRWSPDGKYLVYAKELWYGIAGIYVTPINNPKQQIRIGTDNQAIFGMSWAE
ncbi:MAG: hypothetical protein MUC39_00815 [Candidatus Omnitrophica bacterium]|jgi:Tol biopolymer transport system component|nr:hypothetical protein [Candidatus Omnitrophota bacterium]